MNARGPRPSHGGDAGCDQGTKVWLLNGPGKQTAELPGWTSPVATCIQDDRLGSELHSSEMMVLISQILQILAPFPEARVAVAEGLAGVKK